MERLLTVLGLMANSNIDGYTERMMKDINSLREDVENLKDKVRENGKNY